MKKNYFLLTLIVLLGFTGSSQITAPFTESFNSTSAIPSTWNLSATTGGPWTVTGTMGYAGSTIVDHTGTTGSSRAWMDFSGNDAGVIMTSDTIDVSAIPIPELSFWYNNNLGTNVISPFNSLFVECFDGTAWITIDQIQQDNAGVWSEHYYDLCSFVLTGNKVLVRFRAESGNDPNDFYQDIAIDDISVDTLRVNCFNPIALNARNIATTSSTLGWSAGCSDTAWSVEWGLSGFTLGSGTQVNSAVDSTNLTTLAGNTSYSFYVRGYCTGGDTSSWAGPFTFRTLCSTDTIDYTMDFTSWPPPCWDLTGGVNQWVHYGGTAAEANFWSTSTGDYKMASGPVHVNAHSRVRFSWSHQFNTSYPGDSLDVFIKIDTATSWTKIWGKGGSRLESSDGATSTLPGTYKEEIINLDSATYMNKNVLVRFVAYTGFGPDLFIDDVHIEEIPSCPRPSLLTNLFVLSDSAKFAWTNGLADSIWQVQYGLSGFAPGTGTFKTDNNDSIAIGGLIPGSNYDIYLRSICTVGDTSKWIGPLSFTTLCINDTIPYLMDFTTWPPICWDLTGGSETFAPYAGGIAEANFWSVSAGGDYIMTSQPIHLNDVARIKFDWSHEYNTTYPLDSLRVEVKIDTASSWTKIWGKGGSKLDSRDGATSTAPGTFVTEVYYLDSATYINKNILVRFVAISGFGPDLFIDNVIVEKNPSCPEPASLSHYLLFADSVGLSWINGGKDSIWEVQYGVAGFALGTGTSIIDNNDSTNIGGLSSVTNYDVYVRSICKVGDTSTWVGPYRFTTPCSSYTPPYLEDFSTMTFSISPQCWEEANGLLTVASSLTTGASQWTSDGFGNVGFNGSARMEIWTTGRQEWLISPSIDLGTGTTPYQVEFDVAATQWNNTNPATFDNDDKFYLIISPDNGTTWSDTNILEKWDTGNIPRNTGDYFYYDLTANGYTGKVKFGLYAESTVGGADNNVYVDNFAVVQVPTCPRPLRLAFDTASLTTATLSWTNGAADVSWIIEYGAPGFTLGSGTTYNSGTNPAVVPGLTASTCYDAYLRSFCTAGDTSKWIGPLRFCTECAPVSDICEDFESYASGELPICWDKFIATTGSSTVQIQTFGGNTAPNSVQFNSGNDGTSTMFLVSPEFNTLGAGTHRISVWIDGSNANDTTIIVGTMSNPSNPASFNPVDTIRTITTAYQRFRIPIPATTDGHVAFLYAPGATFRRMNLDDFCYEQIPTCEKAPFVTILNPGQDSISLNLGWNVDTNQSSFFVAYGPTGYDPVTNAAGGDTVTSSSTFKQISGLNPLTEYCFWVKAICKNGDTSAWSGPHCGATGCPSGVSLPYFEDFATYRSVFPLDETPQCWEEATGTLTTSGGISTMTESRWEPDGFGNVGFDGAARFNMPTFGTAEGWIVSPTFNFGSDPNRVRIVEFDVALTAAFSSNIAPNGFGDDDTVALVVSYDRGVTWKSADIIMQWDTSNEPSNTGTHVVYEMRNTSGYVKFGFYGLSNVANEGVEFFVDNFSIRDTVYAGVEELQEDANFRVFPNPNTGVFTVLNDGGAHQTSIKVVDVQGRLVYDESMFFNTKGRKVIDINSFNSGVYVLLIQSDGKLEQHRIIVNK
ncbi:MAG: T9SS type A sorting domain-containing protein [Flavobacteriales bacterium]